MCCEEDYFPKRKFKLFNSFFFTQCLVFLKSLFSIADLFAVHYLRVVRKEDKCCVVTSLTNSRGSRFAGPKSWSRVQSRGRGSNVAVAGLKSRSRVQCRGRGK